MAGVKVRLNERALLVPVEVGVKRVAAEVMAEAIRDCPQDTGTLARSITMDVRTQGKWAVAQVGTPVYYAPFVEFGTRHMHAQPFLGPALARARAKYA